MEGMAKGWDGSRHCTACGHDFISVSIVGPGFADAVPVYVKIATGRPRKPPANGSVQLKFVFPDEVWAD